jgi:hypothetical protein
MAAMLNPSSPAPTGSRGVFAIVKGLRFGKGNGPSPRGGNGKGPSPRGGNGKGPSPGGGFNGKGLSSASARFLLSAANLLLRSDTSTKLLSLLAGASGSGFCESGCGSCGGCGRCGGAGGLRFGGFGKGKGPSPRGCRFRRRRNCGDGDGLR